MAVAACRTAVFSPEKEKSNRFSPFKGRGRGMRFLSPNKAAFSSAGPPG